MFLALSIVVAAFAASLLWVRRVVRAVLALLGAVVGLAFTYFAIGAEAAGAAQLLVYAGGVMVLLLFGVMTTAQLHPEKGPISKPSEVISGGLVALAVLVALGAAFLPALGALENVPGVADYTGGTLAGAGRELINYQAAPFELAALLLLLVLGFAAPFAARAWHK